MNEKSRNRLHDREGMPSAASIPGASVFEVHSGADRAKLISPVREPTLRDMSEDVLTSLLEWNRG